ncbi:MAG: hypothetical protein QXS42_05605 [Zestosphaera sp.]
MSGSKQHLKPVEDKVPGPSSSLVRTPPSEAYRLADLLCEFVRSEVLPKRVDDVIVLSPQRLEGFADCLKSVGRSGRTVEERLTYLTRLTVALGWSFSIDDLQVPL